MFVLVLHPIADLRYFLPGAETGLLPRPNWPTPEPYKDFLRSFGPIQIRWRGGVDEWAGENLYADASLALKLPNFLRRVPLKAGTLSQASISRLFRRFYSSGLVCRYEIGMRIDCSGIHPGDCDAVQLLSSCANISARIRGMTKASSLVTAGPALAAHYLGSTTSRKRNTPVNGQWVKAGIPAFILEYSKNDVLKLPPHIRIVSSSRLGGGTIHHAWLAIAGQRCSAWLLMKDADGVLEEDYRKLRIHLLRLHTERECLRLVLQAFRDGYIEVMDDEERVHALHDYMKQALRVVTQPLRDGIEQSQILEAAQETINFSSPGENASLEKVGRQVLNNLARYIKKTEMVATVINNIQGDQMNTTIQLGNVTVGGDFNVVTARNIENSFNKAGAAKGSEMKEALTKLTVEVANLAKLLPADVAENVSTDLEVLTTEAVSASPRKQWYELSAKGLVEAAKSVAEMAAPIAASVKAVLALIA